MSSTKMNYVHPETLIPYENNPRVNDHAVDGVVRSITEFGFLVPIVVDKDNILVTGHTRLLAAKKMGLTEVPIIRAESLSNEQAKAFRLADNRLAENSTWDETLLADELAMLQDMGFNMVETGFDTDELDCLLEPVNADCLDDLSVENVCGAVKETPKTASRYVRVSVGLFSFLLGKDAFAEWETQFKVNHGPERDGCVMQIVEALGMSEAYDKTIVQITAEQEAKKTAAEEAEQAEAEEQAGAGEEEVEEGVADVG